MLHASHLVEACSIVVSGWGRGLPPPEGLLRAVEQAAGSKPVAVVQPMACFDLSQATEDQATAVLALTEAQAKSLGGTSTTAKARARLDTANSALERAKIAAPVPLDYVFVTLRTSTQKCKVLQAAEGGALLPAGSQAIVCPAPNPRDVLWTNLESTTGERARANMLVLCLLTPLAVINGTAVSFLVLPMTLLHTSPLEFQVTAIALALFPTGMKTPEKPQHSLPFLQV